MEIGLIDVSEFDGSCGRQRIAVLASRVISDFGDTSAGHARQHLGRVIGASDGDSQQLGVGVVGCP